MTSLKTIARAIRDRGRYVLKRRGKADLRVNVPYWIIGDSAYHSFIGYYDIQPFDAQEKRVLIGRVPAFHNGRAMDMPLEIGLYDLDSGDYTKIDDTALWCWQQGCRLQWVNWRGQPAVLYNAMNDGAPASVIVDADTGARLAVLPVPTYCMSADGRLVASLDFDTLERRRAGYGYDWKQNPATEDMAVSLYDTQTGESREILSVAQARAINPHESMSAPDAVHYFNHLHFNPSASRLLVFHIWDVGGKRRVRALTMDVDGGRIADVTGGVHVSHYCWDGDDALIVYGTDPALGAGFHRYAQSGGHLAHFTAEMPDMDGHPTLCPVFAHWMVSDSLVNRDYERDVWLYDLARKRRFDLAHFKSPPRYSGAIRCDLHPRWSPKGGLVAVDSAHAGYRQVVILNVSDIVRK